jgi:hypothetical protein
LNAPQTGLLVRWMKIKPTPRAESSSSIQWANYCTT